MPEVRLKNLCINDRLRWESERERERRKERRLMHVHVNRESTCDRLHWSSQKTHFGASRTRSEKLSHSKHKQLANNNDDGHEMIMKRNILQHSVDVGTTVDRQKSSWIWRITYLSMFIIKLGCHDGLSSHHNKDKKKCIWRRAAIKVYIFSLPSVIKVYDVH